MILKRIISVILLLTLSLQVLPVKQIGAILYSNQINEELPHTDTFKEITKKQISLSEYLLSSNFAFSAYINNISRLIDYSSKIPANYSPEILVPPPNIV